MKQKRWMKSVIATAQSETTTLPWQRGSRRTAMILKRTNAQTKTRSA